MGQSTSQPQLQDRQVLPAGHPPMPESAGSPPPGCPMHAKAGAAAPPAKCPVSHSSSDLNPHNNIPAHLSSSPAPNQAMVLPTERVVSSIPRPPTPDEPSSNRWEYPSPQQFYNALVRKGWETPEEHVETMVEIHNFLNEEAWTEVLKWEKRSGADPEQVPELTRLEGKPGQLSPKARIHLFASKLFPTKFSPEPPFDRHDWVIRRPKTGEEVRYVIDYYSAPDDAEGNPVFSLDVRPALDSFGSITTRIGAATEEAWKSFKSQP